VEDYDAIKKNDRPDVFFQRSLKDRFTPRAVLIDMEPRVINSITSENQGLFDPKNIFVASHGGGAANQWVEGYLNGKRNIETVLNMIDRELDNCDNLEAFQLVHSVSGGTGSGFGSLLLETLSDRYSKKLIQTYSVFGASEVVVQPYNTMLSMKRLIQNSDANVVFDNMSLSSIASEHLKVESPSFDVTNKLISTVMAAHTNTLRFPSYSYNSLTSIVSTLIPTPDLHFIIPSFTPFTSDRFTHVTKEIRRSTTYDVILELLDKNLKMCCKGDKEETVLAMMDVIIRTDARMDSRQNSNIQKALIKARSRVNFAPWTPSCIHLAMSQKSSFDRGNEGIVSGLMLSNSTSILHTLEREVKNYDKLMYKNAFINNYLKSDYEHECGDILQEFQDSRDVVEALINEYRSSGTLAYMEGSSDEEEVGDIEVDDIEMQ
jgi:tubulin gamma